MEQQKVDAFLGFNNENFKQKDLVAIKQKLEQIDDSKFFLIQSIDFQKPSTILLLAILLGIERCWLDQVVLGILKVISMCLCIGLIWWFIDMFTAKNRAKKHNFKKFKKAMMLV